MPSYSAHYSDDTHEYRHVKLTQRMFASLLQLAPAPRLLTEEEWRQLGVQQSAGWCHHVVYEPEPHVLIFRRARSGRAPPAAEASGSL